MKEYCSYKSSGIEWMGEIPQNWQMIQLKYLTENFDKLRIPVKAEDRGNMQGSYPYYGATGIIDYVNDYLFEGEFLLIGEDGAPFFQYADVAFIATGKFWVNNHAHILKPKDNSDVRFLKHVLNSVDFSEYITGSTRDKLTQSSLSQIILPFPSLPEQQAIADFLDHKTVQIDALIAQKQRKIELLQEFRTALINKAVTKGLGPKVPIKDSGIAFLGKVPSHWKITKIKRVAIVIDGDRSSEYPNENNYVEFGIPFLSSKNIMGNKLDYANLKFITNEKFNQLGKGKLTKGDLVVTVRGTIGSVGYFNGLEYTTAFINAQMMILRPNNLLDSIFFYQLAQSNYWLTQLDYHSYGAAQKQLSNVILQNIPIALPNRQEQETIAFYLQQKILSIDNLIKKTYETINQLNEFRTALISEAVTGKIDVRNWKEEKDGIPAYHS